MQVFKETLGQILAEKRDIWLNQLITLFAMWHLSFQSVFPNHFRICRGVAFNTGCSSKTAMSFDDVFLIEASHAFKCVNVLSKVSEQDAFFLQESYKVMRLCGEKLSWIQLFGQCIEWLWFFLYTMLVRHLSWAAEQCVTYKKILNIKYSLGVRQIKLLKIVV